MSLIRVLVHGALGRMGQEVLRAVAGDGELELVGGVDITAKEGTTIALEGGRKIPVQPKLDAALAEYRPQVLVDFTVAEATRSMAPIAVQHGVHMVIGTTGLTPDDIKEVESLCQRHGVGAVVAPNFSLGAVILIHLAKVAAPFFDWAEIIELHHEGKLDAPSGTAIATARAMAQARKGKGFQRNVPKIETIPSTRSGQQDGVTIHSVRLPGLMAHQEVIFGAQGQTLVLRHDTINRECYMPGVLLAIKSVVKGRGLIYGLDKLLGLT
jgi:4-hydroxy-tetrahydrodipicolinate reductase